MLRTEPADLLLTGLGMFDGDVCSLVRAAARPPRRARCIVIITGRRDPRFLSLISELPLDGAYHTGTDGLRYLARALRRVLGGRRYVSRKFDVLLRTQDKSAGSICQLLTDAELHAFAVLSTGCSLKEAAERLHIIAGKFVRERGFPAFVELDFRH